MVTTESSEQRRDPTQDRRPPVLQEGQAVLGVARVVDVDLLALVEGVDAADGSVPRGQHLALTLGASRVTGRLVSIGRWFEEVAAQQVPGGQERFLSSWVEQLQDERDEDTALHAALETMSAEEGAAAMGRAPEARFVHLSDAQVTAVHPGGEHLDDRHPDGEHVESAGGVHWRGRLEEVTTWSLIAAPESAGHHGVLPLPPVGLGATAPGAAVGAPPRVARIGCIGHLRLTPQVRRAVAAAVTAVIEQEADEVFTGYSDLAEGADEVFAYAVLAAGGRLHAVLPRQGHQQGFMSHQFRDRVATLSALAGEVTTVEHSAFDEMAYLSAAHEIVDRSELLIAVWDGAGQDGVGGTRDVVSYARARGVQVRVLWPHRDARSPDAGTDPVLLDGAALPAPHAPGTTSLVHAHTLVAEPGTWPHQLPGLVDHLGGGVGAEAHDGADSAGPGPVPAGPDFLDDPFGQ